MVVHAQRVLMAVPHGIDSSTFLGYINPEIKAMVPLLHSVPEEAGDELLAAVVTYMKDQEAGERAVEAAAATLGPKVRR